MLVHSDRIPINAKHSSIQLTASADIVALYKRMESSMEATGHDVETTGTTRLLARPQTTV